MKGNFSPFFCFQLFHTAERLEVSAQRTSELGLISSTRLDGRKDSQSTNQPGQFYFQSFPTL